VSLGHAIVLKLNDRKEKVAPVTVTVTVMLADEETPLLE
jgi:hypothetical protein